MILQIFLAFMMILIVGVVSLVGLLFISVKEKTLDKVLVIMIAFGTGTIIATAIFDLLPETFHSLEELNQSGANINEELIFLFIMIGFVTFFILERFIYWFHGHAHELETEQYVCHGDIPGEEKENPIVKNPGKVQNFVYLNLIGDGLHNFLDGVIIMVSFLIDIPTGILITTAVILHEIPQEIGDFGILLYGGLTKKKALFYNFLSAMVSMLGGIFALLLSSEIVIFNLFFLAFSTGGFIYIGASEMLPELLKEKNLKKSVIQAITVLIGIGLIIFLINALPHV